jgi:prolyl oligopeptidase
MSTLLAQRLKYPDAPRGNVVEDYHGTKVPDPYRWLENPDAPASRVWIGAENKLTSQYLAGVPDRDKIAQRLTELTSVVVYPRPGGDQAASFVERGSR